MYISILFLPLLGGLILGKFCGIKGGPKLSILLILISMILSLIIFYEVGLTGPVTIILGNWINFSNITVNWSFIYDSITISMLIPILIISTCVQIYSLNYMKNDPHICRFYNLLCLFTFSMLLLITGDNLFILFLGWECVGLISYFLINFWFTNITNNISAIKALFMNKIGDWGIILMLILAGIIFSDFNIGTLLALCHLINPWLITCINCTFILAACAKSAQIGLHTWLVAAMAGPTPVSSLLHSSTMVTAGVILLIRFSPFLEISPISLLFCIWLGSFTALLGASCGLIDNDIKRVIAFSTTSQLGYLFVICGLSQYSLAFTHLLNHSWFKSLLFLASGSFIHAIFDQDIRKMGSLILLSPISALVFILASLSLIAFPFFTGFYSKDFLLELLLIPSNFTHTIAYLFTLIAAFLTSLYTLRLLMSALFSFPHFNSSILFHNDS